MTDHIAQAMMKWDWANVRPGKLICVIDHLIGQDGKIEVDSMNQIMANNWKMKNLHTSSVLAPTIEFLFQLNITLVREAKTTYIIKFSQLLNSTKEKSPVTKMKSKELLEEESDAKMNENLKIVNTGNDFKEKLSM